MELGVQTFEGQMRSTSLESCLGEYGKSIQAILHCNNKKLQKKGKEDSETMVNVSVSIWYTKEFAEMEQDVQGYIDTIFEEANAGLANSKVPMRLKHHGTYLYAGAELPTCDAMLRAFSQRTQMLSSLKDGIMCGNAQCVKDLEKILSVLKTADASFLLISKSNSCGGMGYIDTTYLPFALGTHGHARYDTEGFTNMYSFDTLVSLIHFFRGAYTFLHELSHIFGAGHDKKTATEGKEGEYYKYGYGSSFKKGAGPKQGFRTVLA